MQEPLWIKKPAVLRIHARELSIDGGAPGVRDEGLLESALARPLNTFAYDDQAVLFDLAADYAFGIARNHPCVDGNKRTALLACEGFLFLNGYRVVSEKEEKYLMYIWIAAGQISQGEFTDWLKQRATPVK